MKFPFLIFLLIGVFLSSCSKSVIETEPNSINEAIQDAELRDDNSTDTFWRHNIDPTTSIKVETASKTYLVNKMTWDEVFEAENTNITARYMVSEVLDPNPDESTAFKSTMVQILPASGAGPLNSDAIITSFLQDSILSNENYSGYIITSDFGFNLLKAFFYENGSLSVDTTKGQRLEIWDTPTSPISNNTAQLRSQTYCEYIVFIVYDLNTLEILSAEVMYKVCFGIGGSSGDIDGGNGSGHGTYESTPNDGEYGDCSKYKHVLGHFMDQKTGWEIGWDILDIYDKYWFSTELRILENYNRIVHVTGYTYYDGLCQWNLSYSIEGQEQNARNDACVELVNHGGSAYDKGYNREVEINYHVQSRRVADCDIELAIGIAIGSANSPTASVEFSSMLSNYSYQSFIKTECVTYSEGTTCDNDCE